MCYTRAGLLFVVLCLVALTSARATRNRGQSGGSTNAQYSSVCPSVLCPNVSDTCQTIEFFVMEFDYVTDNGQRATIRCESCEYCLDFPFNLESSRRARRSAHQRRQHHDCSRVSCPDVPSNCDDIRMTDVLLGNTKCRQCPACYDATVFNRT